MRTYLRYVNPAVALVVLALCIWAACYEKNAFDIQGLVGGGFQTYFFAKGLFTCAALVVLGEIALSPGFPPATAATESHAWQRSAIALLLTALALAGLATLLLTETESSTAATSKDEWVVRPADVDVSILYRVNEANALTYAIKVRNATQERFDIKTAGKVYIGGRYSADCSPVVELEVAPGSERTLLVTCATLNQTAIREEVNFEPQVWRKVQTPIKPMRH